MNQPTETLIAPPIAKQIPKALTHHGDERIDPYYWLRNKEDEAVIEHLKAENTYTKSMLKHTEPLQELLFHEIKSRIKETDMSVPYQRDDYFYYARMEEGKNYPFYCRKKGSVEAEEEVMLNVNELAEGHSYYAISQYSISANQQIMAYGVDLKGDRKSTVYFKDLRTGDLLEDSLTDIAQFTWANDDTHFFYTTYDDAMRTNKVYRHVLGAAIEEDVLIFEEEDVTFDAYVSRTLSKDYIFIGTYSKTATEIWFIPTTAPKTAPQLVQKRSPKHEYHVYQYGDKFYLLTNHNAQNFKLMETPISNPSQENWTEVIPHRQDVLLDDLKIFKDYLVLVEFKDGLPHIRIKSWAGDMDEYLPFKDPTYIAELRHNYNFDTEWLRFTYESLTRPDSVYHFNMKTKELVLLKRQEVLGDFDPKNYVSERIYAEAADGKKIPISLVYKKGIKKNGQNPTYLTAYGAYGINYEPYFSSIRLSFLDRGMVYAIAHIRGGQELGRAWYEEGKFLHKKNTFTDFISCSEHLIKTGYTQQQKLVIQGGSAGGLLMGAVMNLRPDLFKGIIAQVPFVDVLTTMLDDSIPLTTGEYEEWGNPNDKTYYDYMKSYSPYDNVEQKDYPTLLVIAGINDSQVHYWEPAKWVAKLREHKTDNNPLLFKINMDAGHGGASARYDKYKELAFEYAFVIDLLGLNDGEISERMK